MAVLIQFQMVNHQAFILAENCKEILKLLFCPAQSSYLDLFYSFIYI